jgi:hypothetical protein
LSVDEITPQGRDAALLEKGFLRMGEWWFERRGSGKTLILAQHPARPTVDEVADVLLRYPDLSQRAVETAFDGWTGLIAHLVGKNSGAPVLVARYPRTEVDLNRPYGSQTTTLRSDGSGSGDKVEIATVHNNAFALNALVMYLGDLRRALDASPRVIAVHGSMIQGGAQVIVGTRGGNSAPRWMADEAEKCLNAHGVSSAFEKSGNRRLPGDQVLEWLHATTESYFMQLEADRKLRGEKETRDRLVAAICDMVQAFNAAP